jgi:hypothetical protein
MLKPILTLAVAGAVGVAAWKLLWILLLPLLGTVLGFAITIVKVGLLVLLVFVAWRLIKSVTRDPAAEN